MILGLYNFFLPFYGSSQSKKNLCSVRVMQYCTLPTTIKNAIKKFVAKAAERTHAHMKHTHTFYLSHRLMLLDHQVFKKNTEY